MIQKQQLCVVRWPVIYKVDIIYVSQAIVKYTPDEIDDSHCKTFALPFPSNHSK